MSAAYVEFARGLELVCRHLNPPHRPMPAAVSLTELGLEGALLKADDRRLAYRYLRGLELSNRSSSVFGAKPIWAAQRGLLSVATAAAEIAPGQLALGDPYGVVRVFVRAARARWECAATLRSHRDSVLAIIGLKDGGFATGGADGDIAFHRRDTRGEWRLSYPTIGGQVTNVPSAGVLHRVLALRMAQQSGHAFTLAPHAAHALCQLDDGTVIVGGLAGVMAELRPLASGDWEARQTGFSGSGPDVVALAAHSQNGFCAVLRDANPQFWFRTGDGNSTAIPAPGGGGVVTDAARRGDDVIACTAAGEIVTFSINAPGERERVRAQVERVASVPIRTIRVLEDAHIATWSEDGQVRIWARERERFSLRAALGSPNFFKPAICALCDGRVAFGESRGFSVGAPQIDGTWRSDEIVSSYEFAINAIAPLGSDRVAYVDNGSRLRVLRWSDTPPKQIAEITVGTAPIVSLAALSGDALAIGCADGRLYVARERAGQWSVDAVPLTPEGSIDHLCAAGGYLASGHANNVVMIWGQTDGQLEPVRTVPVSPGLSALAIDHKGRAAVASLDSSLLYWQEPPAPESAPPQMQNAPGHGPPRQVVALRWLRDGNLLALSADGRVTSTRIEAPSQIEDVRAPDFASSVRPLLAVLDSGKDSPGERIAFARGTMPIEIDRHPVLAAVQSDVRALAAAGDTLFAGGDALYVFDFSRQDALSLRRLVLTDEVVLEAIVDRVGATRSVRASRPATADPWNIVAVGGKPMPNDALLHAHVAVIETDGELGEVAAATNYFFTPDLRSFQIEDPDLPPD